MTDTRRTNFEKIATVETYTPYYNPDNDTYQAALMFGDKVFHSDAFYATADHHFGFITKTLFRAGYRCAPSVNGKIHQQTLEIGHFGRKLLVYRLLNPLTGTATMGIIKCALHRKTLRKSGAWIVSPLL